MKKSISDSIIELYILGTLSGKERVIMDEAIKENSEGFRIRYNEIKDSLVELSKQDFWKDITFLPKPNEENPFFAKPEESIPNLLSEKIKQFKEKLIKIGKLIRENLEITPSLEPVAVMRGADDGINQSNAIAIEKIDDIFTFEIKMEQSVNFYLPVKFDDKTKYELHLTCIENNFEKLYLMEKAYNGNITIETEAINAGKYLAAVIMNAPALDYFLVETIIIIYWTNPNNKKTGNRNINSGSLKEPIMPEKTTAEYYTEIAKYEEALLANSSDYDACIKLAAFCINRNSTGDFDRAIEFCNRILNVKHHDPSALFARGTAYSLSGNTEEALNDLEAVLKTKIKNQEKKAVYYVIGKTYWKNENLDENTLKEVQKAFEKVKAIDPDYADVNDILEKIYTLV